jgi:hypothetical protein
VGSVWVVRSLCVTQGPWVKRDEEARILTYGSKSKGGVACVEVNDDISMVNGGNILNGLE